MGKGLRVEHDFYCIKCGRKGIPLARKAGHQHKSFHRKKLFCIYCNEEVNHVECKNYAEAEQFKEDYAKGVFIDEAAESVSHVRSAGVREDDLDKASNVASKRSIQSAHFA